MNIDYLQGLHKFGKPQKKKEAKEHKVSNRNLMAWEKQAAILELIKDKSMHVPDIAKALGYEYHVARGIVRTLVLKELAINYSVGKQAYFVKAA